MAKKLPEPISMDQIDESFRLVEAGAWSELESWLADHAPMLSDRNRQRIVGVARAQPSKRNWSYLMLSYNDEIEAARRWRRIALVAGLALAVGMAAVAAWVVLSH